jgi:hypothetical protein
MADVTKPSRPPARKDDEGQLPHLRKELYEPEESEDFRQREDELARLGYHHQVVRPAEGDATKRPFGPVQRLTDRQRKLLWRTSGIGFLVVFLIVTAVVGTWWYRQNFLLTDDQIAIAVQGPDGAMAGQIGEWNVAWTNTSGVAWKDVEILITKPDSFRLHEADPAVDISGKPYVVRAGTINPGQNGVVSIQGEFLGEVNSEAVIEAEILLTPFNFLSGQFSKKATLTVRVTASSLELAADVKRETVDGEIIEVPIQVRNIGARRLENMYVRVEVGEGLELLADHQTTSPDFSPVQNGWKIDALEPFQIITKVMAVKIQGEPGSQRSFSALAGFLDGEKSWQQKRVDHVMTISVPSVAFVQKFNDQEEAIVVQPGEHVRGQITYRNNGQREFHNVIISVKLEGEAFDPSSLDLEGGAYDPTTQTIRWSAASVPQLQRLAIEQEGTVSFSFVVIEEDAFPRTGGRLNNFIIRSTAWFESPSLPQSTEGLRIVTANEALLSVGTVPTLETAVFYDDARLGIQSTGPNPPRIGEETTYTVRIRIGSMLNDLGSVVVTGVIPDGVRPTGKTYRTSGDLQITERTGQLRWRVPLVAAGAGRIKPPEELHIQLAIKPGENQYGQPILFFSSLAMEGLDTFVDQSYPYTLQLLPQAPAVER